MFHFIPLAVRYLILSHILILNTLLTQAGSCGLTSHSKMYITMLIEFELPLPTAFFTTSSNKWCVSLLYLCMGTLRPKGVKAKEHTTIVVLNVKDIT